MAKKELTDLQKEYKDLANKLKRKIRDINKRGYVITFPEIKKITKKTLEKLEEVRQNIYKYAKYYDPINEEYISGEQRRQQERQIAARKGWEERRRKEAQAYYDKNFTSEKFKQLVDKAYEEHGIPREAERIMNEVLDMIKNWSPSPTWSSELKAIKQEDHDKLQNIVDGAINEFGFDQCIRNIKDQATWFKSLCQEVLYLSGSKFKETGREGVRKALNDIMTIIRGRPLTVKEAMDIEDIATDLNEAE